MYDYLDNLEIDTPENVILDAQIAGVATRSLAALIDYTIVGLILGLLIYLYARSAQSNAPNNNNILLLLVFTISELGVVIYHLVFEFLMNGQTPGKRAFGLRVIQANGLPVTTSGLLIRNLVRLFDFLPIGYAIGLISIFFTKRTQRLGDLAAKTIVIREQKQINLDNLQTEDRFKPYYSYTHNLAAIPPYIDINLLNKEDRALVFDYLKRRSELNAREIVAPLLARRLARHMGQSENELQLYVPERAEILLEQVARAYERSAQPPANFAF